MSKLVGVLAAVLMLALGSACSSSTATPEATPPPATQAAPVPPLGLATLATPLGTVVTSDGFTVYRFAKDTTKPSKSNCDAKCAQAWPPVLGDGTPALRGISSEQIGTIGRPDGTQQLALNGWPLYRYAKDTRPGDTKGEGVGGTWRAIGVNGKPAADAAGGGKAPAPAPAPAQSNSYGY